ncbi:MAG: glycosyltransferase family 1 protein, partial [Frankiales bacterium]|nr:glycosyltransferase family 1 protein [Frankiales bacterium]
PDPSGGVLGRTRCNCGRVNWPRGPGGAACAANPSGQQDGASFVTIPRVLFISHSSELLGAERSLLTSIEYLRSSLEISILCPRSGPLVDALRRLDVSVGTQSMPWWLARRNGWPMFLSRVAQASSAHHGLMRRVESLGPDLVYTNSLVTPTGAIVAKRLGLPHIWHVRELVTGNGSLRSPLSDSQIYTRVKAWSCAVACNSAAVQGVLNTHGIQAEILPNPVTVPLTGQTGPLPGRAPHLLVVGTLSEAKGQRVAIEALRYFPRDVLPTLHLVGEGPAPYVAELRRLASDLGLREQVTFHGFQASPGDFFLQADLVIVPSAAEAFGRTAIEALMMHKRVIGSDAGGLTELLPRTARFAAGDPESLAAVAVAALAARDSPSEDETLIARHDPANAARLQLEFIRATLNRRCP